VVEDWSLDQQVCAIQHPPAGEKLSQRRPVAIERCRSVIVFLSAPMPSEMR
jgi:hypothetical protein